MEALRAIVVIIRARHAVHQADSAGLDEAQDSPRAGPRADAGHRAPRATDGGHRAKDRRGGK